MKNKKLLIGAAIVIALGVAAYFIFRKPKSEREGVTEDAKKNRVIKIV
jgi:hypothetical protein